MVMSLFMYISGNTFAGEVALMLWAAWRIIQDRDSLADPPNLLILGLIHFLALL